MPDPISGIHHITGICGPAQANMDFYTRTLGLRFVKKTVNFDDPGTYHLYYGDEVGRPGSILTFFPWPEAVQGRIGTAMPEATQFSVPEGTLDFWMKRLADEDIDFEGPINRFGATALRLYDPDRLPLEFVVDPETERRPAWDDGPIPAEYAIRGFFGVTLCLGDPDPTARLLEDTFGYRLEAEDGPRSRYRTDSGERGVRLDLLQTDQPGRRGRGIIHHVAFRADDADAQLTWQEDLRNQGFDVSDVRDRQYFRSIYFREPGGVLFEVATDGPGFTADEPQSTLGQELKLPPWLEERRPFLEKRLPPLHAF